MFPTELFMEMWDLGLVYTEAGRERDERLRILTYVGVWIWFFDVERLGIVFSRNET